MKQKLKICDYHRNGVSGYGFQVGIVDDREDGQKRTMLVIRLSPEADKELGAVGCFVFDLAKLVEGDIRFFHNSFRGDNYHLAFDAQYEDVKAAQLEDAEFYNKPIEKLLQQLKIKIDPSC